jgi:hypothetical protein
VVKGTRCYGRACGCTREKLTKLTGTKQGSRYLKRTGQVGCFFGGEESRREQQLVRTDRLDLQVGELCLAAVGQYEGLSEHRARLVTICGQQGAVDQDSGDVCVVDNLCGRGKKGERTASHICTADATSLPHERSKRPDTHAGVQRRRESLPLRGRNAQRRRCRRDDSTAPHAAVCRGASLRPRPQSAEAAAEFQSTLPWPAPASSPGTRGPRGPGPSRRGPVLWPSPARPSTGCDVDSATPLPH